MMCLPLASSDDHESLPQSRQIQFRFKKRAVATLTYDDVTLDVTLTCFQKPDSNKHSYASRSIEFSASWSRSFVQAALDSLGPWQALQPTKASFAQLVGFPLVGVCLAELSFFSSFKAAPGLDPRGLPSVARFSGARRS